MSSENPLPSAFCIVAALHAVLNSKKQGLEHQISLLQAKICRKYLATKEKKCTFAAAFSKITILLTILTYYESVRNRFHFNSRFV
jgi:hypothetical protein